MEHLVKIAVAFMAFSSVLTAFGPRLQLRLDDEHGEVPLKEAMRFLITAGVALLISGALTVGAVRLLAHVFDWPELLKSGALPFGIALAGIFLARRNRA